jgi:hypothetical protein
MSDKAKTYITLVEVPIEYRHRKKLLGYRWRWADIISMGLDCAEKIDVSNKEHLEKIMQPSGEKQG